MGDRWKCGIIPLQINSLTLRILSEIWHQILPSKELLVRVSWEGRIWKQIWATQVVSSAGSFLLPTEY